MNYKDNTHVHFCIRISNNDYYYTNNNNIELFPWTLTKASFISQNYWFTITFKSIILTVNNITMKFTKTVPKQRYECPALSFRPINVIASDFTIIGFFFN